MNLPPQYQRPPCPYSTTSTVMLRSILTALPSASFVFNPSLSHLRHTQISKSMILTPFNLHKHRYQTKPFCRKGSMLEVLEILGPLEHLFPSLNLYPYVALLRKCIRSRSFFMGSLIHGDLIKSGFKDEILLSNVLLNMYMKLGLLDDGVKLFDEMPERDVVSWCTLISGYVSNGFGLQAYGLFKEMHDNDVKPNHYLLSSVLNGCSASGVLELGLLVHGMIIKAGFEFDRFVEVGLVAMYAKCGSLADALKMFYGIPVKCSVSWNAMISAYVQNGYLDEALELFREMCRVGLLKDLVTLRVVASACSALDMFDFCKSLHACSIKIGLDGDSFMVAELVRLLTKFGEVAYMKTLFRLVKKPDASLCSLLISGYHLHGHRAEAVKLAQKLLGFDLDPREGALVSVLNLCLCIEEGTQLHGRLARTGHLSYTSVGNVLMSIYFKYGEMVDANKIFVSMVARDVVSWTVIMTGCVKNDQFGEALELFHAFRKNGIELDQYSIVAAINACTGCRAIGKGKQIHALSMKIGIEFSNFLSASLVHMYARCGYIETASWLFSFTSFPHDLLLTNVMLGGFCSNAQPEKAIKLFAEEYHFGLVPDQFSLSTLLRACADARSVEMGTQIHCHTLKSGFDSSDAIIRNGISNMYLKLGSIGEPCKLSDKKFFGYIQEIGSNGDVRIFPQLQQSGIGDRVTFARLLKGAVDFAATDLCKLITASSIKNGLVSSASIGYGNPTLHAQDMVTDRARESFDEMRVKESMLNSQGNDQEVAYDVAELLELKEIENYNGYMDLLVRDGTAASLRQKTSILSHAVRSRLRLNVPVRHSVLMKSAECF